MKPLASVLLLASLFLGSVPAPEVSLRFVALGDMPYSATTEREFGRLLRRINRLRPRPEFVVHVGDIMDGGTACSPASMSKVRNQMDTLVVPWAYTPGDNEWVDCKTSNPDVYYDLANLRAIFFTDRASLARHQRFGDWMSQGAPFENFRWESKGVVFGTVHLVTWQEAFPKTELAVKEFFVRSVADKRWVSELIVRANQVGSRVIVIFGQCRPKPSPTDPSDNDTVGVKEFFDDLHQMAKNSPNIRFVYIYGDDHRYKAVSEMYPGYSAPNLQSIGVPGDADIRAVQVSLRLEASGSLAQVASTVFAPQP